MYRSSQRTRDTPSLSPFLSLSFSLSFLSFLLSVCLCFSQRSYPLRKFILEWSSIGAENLERDERDPFASYLNAIEIDTHRRIVVIWYSSATRRRKCAQDLLEYSTYQARGVTLLLYQKRKRERIASRRVPSPWISNKRVKRRKERGGERETNDKNNLGFNFWKTCLSFLRPSHQSGRRVARRSSPIAREAASRQLAIFLLLHRKSLGSIKDNRSHTLR